MGYPMEDKITGTQIVRTIVRAEARRLAERNGGRLPLKVVKALLRVGYDTWAVGVALTLYAPEEIAQNQELLDAAAQEVLERFPELWERPWPGVEHE